ncbi:glycoside hydrolase family 32 protein [Mongoliitalea daihaiensis]|nr:glycoside hydrolase family 32 protein [Mongoliitalea daihaiensis]UJP67079.1 glycoside hydrolase family 32 protein [Mongoliitalea daihaiensis]
MFRQNSILLISLICIGMILACTPNKEKGEKLKYQEQYRPQFHFSPEANWMNDPNGMVYWDGEYHLFYQYYPDGNVWGPMHWGHAISEDLVYWEHLPIALYPDSLGYIFSGSAVVDHANTSGLGKDGKPPMVAIYTYHDPIGEAAGRDDFQTQGIAYSLDNGRTWEVYQDNPVLANPGIKDFRDPKVIWDEQTQQWIMSLAVLDKIRFYTSPNLLNWTFASDFQPSWAAYGGVWECPDLFPLKTESGEEKWVLLVSINPGGPQGGSATQYFIGDFDGKTFNPTQEDVEWIDWGADNYAGVTWSNIPEEDGRRLFIGWMSNWDYAQVVPTTTWRSAMTLPRALSLYTVKGKVYLKSKPVEELKALRGKEFPILNSTTEIGSKSFEVHIPLSDEKEFEITFSNDSQNEINIYKVRGHLVFNRSKSGNTSFMESFGRVNAVKLPDIQLDMISIYFDQSSIEIFINDGQLAMTNLVFPKRAYTHMDLVGINPAGKIYHLNSIWN